MTTATEPMETGPTPPEPAGARGLRRAGTVAAEVALWITGVLGLACIVLVLAATFWQVSIIMFKTGSMSPAIPAGSAALVREIPVDEVRIGDVVTVDRPGALPVTHRVLAVAGEGEVRALTLKGDANPVPDPQPYQVERVRTVLFAVPGLAYALAWLSQPPVLLAGVVLLAMLVTWAFWPRRARAAASAAVLLIAIGCPVVAPAPSAQAAPIEVTRTGEVLRLTVISDPDGMAAMAPGSTERWIVGVSADAPDPGEVHVRLVGEGEANRAFTVGVEACRSRFVGDGCPASLLPGLDPVSPSPVGEVLRYRMADTEQLWIAVSVTLAEDAVPGATTTYSVVADGFGEELSTDDPPDANPAGPNGGGGLASSGTDALPFVAAALAVVGVGGAALAGARRRGGRR